MEEARASMEAKANANDVRIVDDLRITGYPRPDGQVGIRNWVAIIYSVACSEVVARRVHSLFPQGTVLFGIPQGCHWTQSRYDKIVALGRHPNVAGAVVIGLGCEGTEAHLIAEDIAKTGKPAESLTIQATGGDLKTIEAASRMVAQMLQHASLIQRSVEITPADLIVGAECGGSDATSGLTSNPAVGVAADLLIEAGGTFMIEETSELLGTGQILAERSIAPEVARAIQDLIHEAERQSYSRGWFSIGLGNILGGLTTIEEKSAGCLSKAGSKPLQGVITSFTNPPGKGLYIQDPPADSFTGDGDPQGIMGMAGSGAHLALFTTGCGSVTGGVVVPVIKICGNPASCARIADNLDIDASPVMRGEKTVREIGEEIYREILAVAAGKLTKSEIMGHFED